MKIRVITSPSCPVCSSIKKYLESNNVEFEEVNILEDDKLRDSLENLTLPQIEVDGTIMIVGFNKEAVDGLIKRIN